MTAELPAGTILRAGLGISTVLPDMDFETYSSAGSTWNKNTSTWDCLRGASKKGLTVVGAARYAEHFDTEVLSFAYNLKDGKGPRLWLPNTANINPVDLFNYLAHGGLIEAWNSSFEYWIWNIVCVKKYGWPTLSMYQLRDAMAKSRAHCWPGSLDAASKVLNLKNKKDERGKRLLKKFSVPRNPTKKNANLRTIPHGSDPDGRLLYEYNLQDIAAESEASNLTPDLSPAELEFWLCDQAINFRGVQIDVDAIKVCVEIIEQAYKKYNLELYHLTNYEVNSASEIAKLTRWINTQGVDCANLTADLIEELIKWDDIPPNVRRVLKIRELLGSAAVKKLYAMLNQVSSKGRLHDLFIYHSARTGRAAGAGPQPQNLPNSGPEIAKCTACKKHFRGELCPWCSTPGIINKEWGFEAVEDALFTIKTKSLECVEYYWGDNKHPANAVEIISSCLRGLFIAAPGHDLICSDYSAIEAVVLAALADEEWRLEVFRTHGKIYEMSASKITGTPFEEFERYQLKTGGVKQDDGTIKGGQHHPLRKKVGKVAELASGYQGWTGAWKQFGADAFFSEEEMKTAILAWRKASPNITEMWGGQFKKTWGGGASACLYGLEGAAISAMLSPGKSFNYKNKITYFYDNDILYCRLLSGRYITYHKPKLQFSNRGGYNLSFEGWNTNPKNGPVGWIRINTYGGRLTENIVQATARDILANAIVNLEKSGYKIVLHVHDEIVAEVLEGQGSITEFENIMNKLPTWANGWPIKATGGWRGKRYRK